MGRQDLLSGENYEVTSRVPCRRWGWIFCFAVLIVAPIPRSVRAIPQCTANLTCDQSLTGTINASTERDLLCFSVTRDQRVNVSVVGLDFFPTWRLVDVNG